MEESKIKIEPELKEIVLQRILSSKLPSNIKLSVGNSTEESMGILEMAEHVKKEDEIGKKIIRMELNYLKILKEGIVEKIQSG
jgi:hypothetical protein